MNVIAIGGSAPASVGGFFGESQGVVTNCSTTGSVTIQSAFTVGDSFVGGFVGHARSYSISNSFATGAVSGSCTVDNLWRIAGFAASISIPINNCFSTGFITVGGSGARAGGFGGIHGGGTVSNCYSTGSISGTVNIGGGFVGDTQNTPY